MHSTYETLAPPALGTLGTSPIAHVSPLRVGRAVWRFLGAFSQRKVAAEILELAASLQPTRPETAAQMRRAASGTWD